MRTNCLALLCCGSLVMCAGGDGTGMGDDDIGPGFGGNGSGGEGGAPVISPSSSGSGGTVAVDDVTSGAVSLNFLAPAGCLMTAEHYDLPPIGGGHPVTATSTTELLRDGEMASNGELAEVSCTWFSTQAPYRVSISMSLGPLPSQRVVALGSQFTPGAPSDGTVSFSRLDTSAAYVTRAASPCSFDVIELDPATRSVWGSFSCDTFDASDGSDVCSVGISYFYIANCRRP